MIMLVVHTSYITVTELMSVEFTEMSFATLNYGRPVFSLVLLMLTVTNLKPFAIGQQGKN